MVNFYVMRIKNEEMELSDVPKLWQEKVKKKLEQLD